MDEEEKKFGIRYQLAKIRDHLEIANGYLKDVNVYVNNMEDAERMHLRANEKLQAELNDLRAWYSTEKMKERNL